MDLLEMPQLRDGDYVPFHISNPIEGVDPSIKSVESLSTRFTKLGEFSVPSIPKIEVFRGKHRKTIIVAGIPHEEDPYYYEILCHLELKDRLTFQVPAGLAGKEIEQITSVYVTPRASDNRIAMYLYLFLANTGITIVSDSQQHVPGKILWKNLLRKSSSLGVQIRLIRHGKLINDPITSDYPEDQIWTSSGNAGGKSILLALTKE
jgi:hypothetical protein